MTNERTDKGDIIEPVASLVQKVVYPSFSMGLNQITSIYRDLRSKTYVKERVGTFDERATTFIEKLQLYAGGKSTFGLIYLHILQQHISPFMLLWGETMALGYGYFSTTAGEHLNKRIKFEELNHSNLDSDRFVRICTKFRTKQLHYPDCIITKKTTPTCSACHEEGHTKKNKLCPLHPDMPPPEFDNSDDEL